MKKTVADYLEKVHTIEFDREDIESIIFNKALRAVTPEGPTKPSDYHESRIFYHIDADSAELLGVTVSLVEKTTIVANDVNNKK